jgi:hypothetical protein
VSSAQSLDRKQLAAAFTRAQSLLASTRPVSADDVQRLEEMLRPLASAPEVRRVIVPLLDQVQLFGLAMAWDSSVDDIPEKWLLARADRFVQLTAPEFAFLTLCELRRMEQSGAAHGDAESPEAPFEVELTAVRDAALRMLEAERAVRVPTYAYNLAVIEQQDRDLALDLKRSHRTSVALRPVGTGLAEYAGPGQPWVQLWAVTASAAQYEADRLARQSTTFEDSFIAGIGDCSLPEAAARIAREGQRVHIVELQVARVRALLEVVDLCSALTEGRVRLHVGTRGLSTLAPYAQLALENEASVVGGDPVAVQLLRAAAGQ